MRRSIVRKRVVLLVLSVVLVGVLGASAVATGTTKKVRASVDPATNYGPLSPTFVGPAATGCASGCSLLTGPFTTGSTASSSSSNAAAAQKAGTALSARTRCPPLRPEATRQRP